MNIFCFDLETTSLDITSAKIVGVGFCYEDGIPRYIDAKEESEKEFIDPKEWCIEQIKEADLIIGHNLAFDLAILGNPETPQLFDTMIAEQVLYPDQDKFGLKPLHNKYFTEPRVTFDDLYKKYKGKGKTAIKKKDFSLEVVPPEEVAEYCKQDILDTYGIYLKQKEELKRVGLEDIFYGLEMEVLKVILSMKMTGLRLDLDHLKSLDCTPQIKEALLQVQTIAKAHGMDELNVNSPKQLSTLLYEKLGLEGLRKTNNGFGTDEKDLSQMLGKHPVIQHLLDYRKYTKFQGTYLESLPNKLSSDGLVHPEFKQTGTATGRMSCTEPNVQNIPKKDPVFREIRKAFIPREGNIFIIGDYGQMELRMLAHYSNDDEMIRAFKNDIDLHKITASDMFKKPFDEITPEERDKGKTVNFATIYGQGAEGLSKVFGIPQRECQNFIYRYACRFNKAWTWRKERIRNREQLGYAETIMGRTRNLNMAMPKQKTRNLDFFRDRLAVNTPVQGSCADLMKLAMIRVHKGLQGTSGKIIMQIHDELIVECKIEDTERVKSIVQGGMESIGVLNGKALNCPFKVEITVGKNWGDK